MKSIRLLMVLFALAAFSGSAYAQSGSASLSPAGAVVLPTNEELKSSYVIDATAFNFTDQSQAIAYLQTVNTELAVYRPVLHNNEVVVYLQLKKQPNWTIAQWNQHLAANKAVTGPTPEPTQQTTN